MRTLLKALLAILMVLALAWLAEYSGLSPHFGSRDWAYGQEPRLMFGDSLAWRQPGYNDAHWPQARWSSKQGLFWIRSRILLDSGAHHWENPGLAVELLASCEAYWDGVRIGQNGQPGLTAEQEREGRYFSIFLLPDSLAQPGLHTVAFRCSNHFIPRGVRYFGLRVGDYSSLYRQAYIFTIFIHTLSGVFLVAAVYYLFQFWFNRRKSRMLLFGLFCANMFALIFFEYLKFYYWYPYSFHYTRLAIIEWLTVSFALLLFFFFLSAFRPRGLWLLFILFAGAILALRFNLLAGGGHDGRIFYMSALAFIASLVLSGWALYHRKTGAAEGFIGLAPGLVLFAYYELVLFFSFFNLILFQLLAHTREQRMIRQQRNEARLRSARLEAELLKKQIQPHFLMNTLASLIEWIESEPAEAARFVEALGGEFKLLNRIANKKLIPIEDELALCRSFLRIMSYRKGMKYCLETKGIPNELRVPPALLHTLVENGVTHCKSNGHRLLHCISYRKDGRQWELQVTTHGKPVKKTEMAEGTGLRYVKARLEESYPGRWAFRSEPADEGWSSTIRIIKKEGGE